MSEHDNLTWEQKQNKLQEAYGNLADEITDRILTKTFDYLTKYKNVQYGEEIVVIQVTSITEFKKCCPSGQPVFYKRGDVHRYSNGELSFHIYLVTQLSSGAIVRHDEKCVIDE